MSSDPRDGDGRGRLHAVPSRDGRRLGLSGRARDLGAGLGEGGSHRAFGRGSFTLASTYAWTITNGTITAGKRHEPDHVHGGPPGPVTLAVVEQTGARLPSPSGTYTFRSKASGPSGRSRSFVSVPGAGGAVFTSEMTLTNPGRRRRRSTSSTPPRS